MNCKRWRRPIVQVDWVIGRPRQVAVISCRIDDRSELGDAMISCWAAWVRRWRTRSSKWSVARGIYDSLLLQGQYVRRRIGSTFFHLLFFRFFSPGLVLRSTMPRWTILRVLSLCLFPLRPNLLTCSSWFGSPSGDYWSNILTRGCWVLVDMLLHGQGVRYVGVFMWHWRSRTRPGWEFKLHCKICLTWWDCPSTVSRYMGI